MQCPSYMRNLVPAWDMAKLPGPSGPRIFACDHLSRLAVFGGRWEKGTLIFKCLQTVRIDL